LKKENIAFIPVRIGSKGIPKKNIRHFCGVPLVGWVLRAAISSLIFDKVVVASDSEEIDQVVKSFGLKNIEIFQRSKSNAQDDSSTESVMLEYLTLAKTDPDSIFFLIQATSPFLSAGDIINGFNNFNHQDVDSVVSCSKKYSFHWTDQGKSSNYDYKNRPRRQDFQGQFVENGAFYISYVKDILKNNNRISGRIGLSEMEDYTSIEIDELYEWIGAEAIMKDFVFKKKMSAIKVVATDVDGVLTDSGMYYDENSNELKKFNTKDGMAFQILREKEVKTAIITSETSDIVIRRGIKIKSDYTFTGKVGEGKLDALLEICRREKVNLSEVAYIGDDINCINALNSVGIAGCPSDAAKAVKNIYGIWEMQKKGGEGVFREFVDFLL
jgi:N-acylneuraminate cytidylyltransferase